MSYAKHGSRALKELRSYRVTSEENSAVVLKYLEALDCPRSLTVALLFKNGEHEQLAKLSFNPLDYLTITEFRDAYSATKFLSKFKDLTLDYDVKEVAMLKFEKFEDQCKLTNSRFRNLSVDPKYKGRAVWLHNAVIRKIDKILGEFDLQEFFEAADWGPGATTLLTARKACSTNKFQSETGITRDLYSLLPSEVFTGMYPLWSQHLQSGGVFPTFQIGNKVVTVPKDATEDRVIAIEPGLNLWFQLAIGSMIKKRLLRYGIDLRYQSTNQRLAKVGSEDLSLATVDFSSASDSISLEVARAVLPPRWFLLMDGCRSHYGSLDSGPRKWNKFSSMGNGFTFQLESLIFYAVATCCMEYLHMDTSRGVSTVSVYGDDVIIPVACLTLFAEISEFYGFSMNMKKTHFSSQFRESCGEHYVSGFDVKPIYLKGKISDIPSIYRLANAVRRQAHRRGNSSFCDARLRPVFDYLVRLVPKTLRFGIPFTLGDGGFIMNFDEATPVRARRDVSRGFEGYRVPNVVESSITRQSDVFGLLLARLWSSERGLAETAPHQSRALLQSTHRAVLFLKKRFIASLVKPKVEAGNSISSRGSTKRRIVKSLVHQWYDLGPWI